MIMLRVILWGWLTFPHVVIFLLSNEKKTIIKDIDRWADCTNSPLNKYFITRKKLFYILELQRLLLTLPEYRNLFYLRIGKIKYLLYYLRPLSTLYIYTPSKSFGEGTFIQHGFATVITAENIGKNCWINQQVTIGYNNSKKYGYGKPWIGDNVRIASGAIVCGKVSVGNGSIIGVNSVIVKDVPENSTIIPSPMCIIRENGKIVNKKF